MQKPKTEEQIIAELYQPEIYQDGDGLWHLLYDGSPERFGPFKTREAAEHQEEWVTIRAMTGTKLCDFCGDEMWLKSHLDHRYNLLVLQEEAGSDKAGNMMCSKCLSDLKEHEAERLKSRAAAAQKTAAA